MWPDDNDLVPKKSITFANLFPKELTAGNDELGDALGGFLNNGSYGWIAKQSLLQIVCVESGAKMATFDFDTTLRTKNAEITCVEQIYIDNVKTCLLAVGLQFPETGGLICILSVQGSRLLHAIDIYEKITSCSFINTDQCTRGVLRTWDSCLAIGTEQGKIFLYELNLQLCRNVLMGTSTCVDISEVTQSQIAFANMSVGEIENQRRQSKEQTINFGVQLEMCGPVLSILAIPTCLTLATGLTDGRLILYDLEDLQIFHMAFPPYENAPLINFCVMEPTDDPRANLYVWSLHVCEEGAIAVMHALIFESKIMEDNVCYYDTFNSCHVRLTMPMYDSGSVPLSCQSISKVTNQGDEIVKLCQIGWVARDKATHTIIFDLNQWYKAQMPSVCNWRHFPSYIAAFEVDKRSALNVFLNEESLVPFNSIQRPEEHFRPNSLCFDLNVLFEEECGQLNWPGLQQKILGMLTRNGAYAILNPEEYFEEMQAAALVPQFYDFNVNKYSTVDEKRDYLLSIALEYNCVNILKQCAISWADGSHVGLDGAGEGVALSTITDWIWQRAKLLKETSNDLCVPLFDFSGQPIDYVIQKSLAHCTRQLKILSDLFAMIVTRCRQYIPESIVPVLDTQAHSIQVASDYQDVLQWLLNVGMLPEGLWRHEEEQRPLYRRHLSSSIIDDEFISVPYPYHVISGHYKTQRAKLSEGDRRRERPREPRTHMRAGLFIDEFIERELNAKDLKALWRANGGSADYPPSSLQTMLRTLLIADITPEQKYILFVYLFLDINSVMNEGRYAAIVQNLVKFPTVFKMNPGTIKRTQGFWYFDHGHLETAVDELISPLTHDHQPLPVWQRELLIATLLKQGAPHLALRVLRSPGLQIAATLELETLMANKLVSEAFKFQRSKRNPHLLLEFFDSTLKTPASRDMLLDFAYTENEEVLFEEFLQRSDQPLAENMHMVYLLQRSKFNQAVNLVDNLGKGYNVDIPKEVLSIYHSNLEPTTRHLTYLTYQNRDKFTHRKKVAEPKPLSTRLFNQRSEVGRESIFQKSILSVKEAGDEVNDGKAEDFSVPFIRRPGFGIFSSNFQAKTHSNCNVVYPVKIQQKAVKRKFNHDELGLLSAVCGVDQPDTAIKEVFTFNELQGPTKRRRVNESTKSLKDINFKILTVFQERKPVFNFSQQPALQPPTTQTTNSLIEKTPVKIPPEIMLTTPVVSRKAISRLSPASSISRYTPQSILKTHSRRHSVSPVPTEMSSRMSTVDFDEKAAHAIRFNLPTSGADTTLEVSSAIENYSDYFEKTIDSVEKEVAAVDTVEESIEDTSAVSVDVYFSPETSTREEQAYKTLLTDGLLSGSFSRPPINVSSQSIFERSFSRKELPTDVVDEAMDTKEEEEKVEKEAEEEERWQEVQEEPCVKRSAYVCGPESEVAPIEVDLQHYSGSTETKFEKTTQASEFSTMEIKTNEKISISGHSSTSPHESHIAPGTVTIIPIEIEKQDEQTAEIQPTISLDETLSTSEDSSPLPSPIKKDRNVLQDDSIVEERQWKSFETTNSSVNDSSVFERHTILDDNDGNKRANEDNSSSDSSISSSTYGESEEDEPVEEFDTDDDDIVKYYDKNSARPVVEEESEEDDDEDIIKYYDHDDDEEDDGNEIELDDESDFSGMSDEANKPAALNKSDEVIDILDSSDDDDDDDDNDDQKQFEELKAVETVVPEKSIYDEDTVSNGTNEKYREILVAQNVEDVAAGTAEEEQMSAMMYDNMEVDEEAAGDNNEGGDNDFMSYGQLEEQAGVRNIEPPAAFDVLEIEENLANVVAEPSTDLDNYDVVSSQSQQLNEAIIESEVVEEHTENLNVEKPNQLIEDVELETQISTSEDHQQNFEPAVSDLVMENTAEVDLNEAAIMDESIRSTQSLYVSADGQDLELVTASEQDDISTKVDIVANEVGGVPELVTSSNLEVPEDLPTDIMSGPSDVVDEHPLESSPDKVQEDIPTIVISGPSDVIEELPLENINPPAEVQQIQVPDIIIASSVVVEELPLESKIQIAEKLVEVVEEGPKDIEQEVEEKATDIQVEAPVSEVPVEEPMPSTSSAMAVKEPKIEEMETVVVLRNTRARSQSIDTQPTALDSPSVRRLLRGKSVPKQTTDLEHLTPKKRSLRSASVETPDKHLASKPLLDVIAEDAAVTPIKRGRRKTSVDTPEISSTPRRITRRSSTNTPIKEVVEVKAGGSAKMVEDTTTPRKRGRARASSIEDDTMSEKSSGGSSRALRNRLITIQSPEQPTIPEEPTTPVTPKTPNTPITPPDEFMDHYSQLSRRLTRSQIQVLNKSAEVTRKTAEMKRMFRARSASHIQEDDGNVSDSSSVASTRTRGSNVSHSPSTTSKRSSNRRATRRSATDDTESVASSTRSKTKGHELGSPMTPTKNLTVIQEEQSEDDSSVASLVIDEDPPQAKKQRRGRN